VNSDLVEGLRLLDNGTLAFLDNVQKSNAGKPPLKLGAMIQGKIVQMKGKKDKDGVESEELAPTLVFAIIQTPHKYFIQSDDAPCSNLQEGR